MVVAAENNNAGYLIAVAYSCPYFSFSALFAATPTAINNDHDPSSRCDVSESRIRLSLYFSPSGAAG